MDDVANAFVHLCALLRSCFPALSGRIEPGRGIELGLLTRVVATAYLKGSFQHALLRILALYSWKQLMRRASTPPVQALQGYPLQARLSPPR